MEDTDEQGFAQDEETIRYLFRRYLKGKIYDPTKILDTSEPYENGRRQYDYEDEHVKIHFISRITHYKGDTDRMADYTIYEDGKCIADVRYE